MSHWFLRENHVEFRDAMGSIIETAARDVCRQDARATLGDEHDQSMHLFTKIYTLMREREADLTRTVLCCSRLSDPVVELRYYRSRPKRSKKERKWDTPFVERETGADFALVLDVDFSSVLKAQRSVLGQAKILDRSKLAISDQQLRHLLEVAGPESATYLIWGAKHPPTVVSAENVAAFTRTQGMSQLAPDLLAFGQPLSEFFCEAFLGLWFGRDYDPQTEGEEPPEDSIPILYHFLHLSVPPPNVVYFGMTSGRRLGVRPGVYVNEVVDI